MIVSERLAAVVRHNYGADADRVPADLASLPDRPGGQDPERMGAALVLGEPAGYEHRWRLYHLDWRDLLVGAELAHGDWPLWLDSFLDRPSKGGAPGAVP